MYPLLRQSERNTTLSLCWHWKVFSCWINNSQQKWIVCSWRLRFYYEAQNRDANKEERLFGGFKAGLLLEVLYGAIILVFTYLFREPIISMFVTGESAESIIELGSK